MTKTFETTSVPLPARLALESLVGIASALTVSPAVTIIDKAIVSNASGLESLLPSIVNSTKGMVLRPYAFARNPAFLLIWGVYSGTYIVGNAVTAICELRSSDAFLPKFVLGSAANVTLSALKDKAFARMFAAGSTANLKMPNLSMFLFASRDSMTILSSFSLPPKVSNNLLQGMFNLPKMEADVLAQVVTPCAMQIFSTPLHLYGLDLYNRPGGSGTNAVTNTSRYEFVKREYGKTVLARMSRILPAFGIGGVLNKEGRKGALVWAEEAFGK